MFRLVSLIFVCFILLLLSAFFSSSETALFSMSESEIMGIKTSNRRRKSVFHMLMFLPQNLLTTILLSNTLVNVTFSFLFTLLFLEFIPRYHFDVRLSMLIDTILITSFLLIFGEFTPKFYSLRKYKKVSSVSASLLFYFVLILKPIVFLLNIASEWIIKLTGSKINEQISFSELETLFEISENTGVIKDREKEIIKSLFTLSEARVSDIMLPRVKVFSISEDAKIGKVYKLLKKKPYSRIPVYSKNKEKIIGLLYLKDILIHREQKNRQVKSILRSALFVPMEMKLKDLFCEFRKKRVHFAIVVNEFGGTEGVVTVSDILEEIVGTIKDEYHRLSSPRYRYVSKNEIIVDGELKIDEFPKGFYSQLPHGDYETISGFILSSMGKVPTEDMSFVYEHLVFTIVKLNGRKLEKILVSRSEE